MGKLDILFLIPTYNRYDSLKVVINRIVEQVGSLNYKIIVIDDYSNDPRYSSLSDDYKNLVYLRNIKNNGRDFYYLTVNELFKQSLIYRSEKYVFLADDSLPSKNFISYIDRYLQLGAKVVNTAIHKKETYKNWNLDNWVDGGFVITDDIFSKINYPFETNEIRTNFTKESYGTGVFKAFSERLLKFKIKVHFPKYSLLDHLGHTDSVMHTEIRKKEQIHSYMFVDKHNDSEIFRPETYKLIKYKIQIKISDSVKNFKRNVFKKYKVTDYNSIYEPTVFFGLYDNMDYESYKNHLGPKIIVWCGTDALNVIKKNNWHNTLKSAFNVSMSSFIKNSLDSVGIPNVIIPVTPTTGITNPKTKGENIFWYYNSEGKRKFYGGDIVDTIKKLTNYNIIETPLGRYNETQIQKIYESCFLGLRLTEHDGLSNTVVELGLLGRKCIHNGDSPNSIKYDKNNIKKIIELIDFEYKNRNTVDYELAKKVCDYLKEGEDFNKIFFAYDTEAQIKIQNIIGTPTKTQISKNISIIIPTYKNTNYIDECIDSVIESTRNQDVEILVGIDGCKETLEYVKSKTYPENIKFYYFEKNVGPYIIKNSLSEIANGKNLLFFDSDDIMDQEMVKNSITSIAHCDFIRHSYINFKDSTDLNKNKRREFEGGIFTIKKQIFDKMNGFEPWKCEADSEFALRMMKNGYKIKVSNNTDFFRRIHNNGLTSRSETGYNSKLRADYRKIYHNKKDFGPLPKKVTELFTFIPVKTYSNGSSQQQVKQKNSNILGPVLNKVRVEVSKKEEQQQINYEKVNEVVQKREVQKKPERPKPEPRPVDKNSNSAMAQNVRVSKKPIRTNAKPINLNGGKNFLRI
jgi:glycosyltransferase involved in cell wall biosynthesis